jgi:membrane protease YdiL (CAAX protease family)
MNSTLPAPFESNKPSQNVLIIIGMFIIAFVIANVVGILCMSWITHKSLFEMGNLDFTDHNVLVATYVGQVIASIITFIVPAALFTFLVTKNRLEYLKFNHGSKIIMFLLAAVIMACANPLIDFFADLNSKIPFPDFIRRLEEAATKEEQALLAHQGLLKLTANVFMIGALAAFCEELFFRAVLQRTIIEWTGNAHAGIWITGIIFSAAHLEFYGFFPRLLMGVYLGYLFVWSGSIWVPMLAHFINNSLIVVVVFFNPAMVTEDKLNLGTDAQQTMYISISAVIVTGLLFIMYKVKGKKGEAIPIS